MAIGLTDDKHYQAIAQALRDNVVTTKSYMPGEMAEEIYTIAPRHYEIGRQEGYEAGKAEGGDTDAAYEQGVADGKQAENDRFWDSYQQWSAYQQDGKPKSYMFAFATDRWTDETFKPKYDIIASGIGYMFRSSGITDLKGILQQRGFKITCSSGSVEYFAQGSALTSVPEMEIEGGLTVFTNAFNGCTALVSVDKLNLSTTALCECKNAFRNCTALTEIRFNSGIRPHELNFAQSTAMSRESFASQNEDGKGYGLIPALADGVSGSITVSQAAVDANFTSTEWKTLTGTKTNWTISLL